MIARNNSGVSACLQDSIKLNSTGRIPVRVDAHYVLHAILRLGGLLKTQQQRQIRTQLRDTFIKTWGRLFGKTS